MARARLSRFRSGGKAGLTVLLSAPMLEAPSAFAAAIEAALPAMRVWPDGAISDNAVDVVITDDHAELGGRRFMRLSTVLSLSAGVEHLVNGGQAFEGTKVYRILTPQHQQLMREYVIHQMLASESLFRRAEAQERLGQWEWLPPRMPMAGRHAVVLGLGFLGEQCAKALRDLDLVVTGFNLTGRRLPGIHVVNDLKGLRQALRRADFLVCLLPLTNKTRGLIGPLELELLPNHAIVVNVSRSGCIDEAALIEMLNTHRLAGAVLDVFEREPLPPNHPIWQVPNLRITPHCAATPPAEAYLPAVIDALARLDAGEVPCHPVEAIRGY